MKQWISDLSTTNFRIFVSIVVAVIVVLTLLAGLILRIEMQTEVVFAILAFVGAMLGIDVTQFSIKRKTEIVTPPQVTAEHAVPAPIPPADSQPDKP